MKNSAYHCPYDLVDNKVNDIYIVYKIRKYDNTVLVRSTITSSPVEWAIIIVVYASSRMKSPTIWISQISVPVTIIHGERINGKLSVYTVVIFIAFLQIHNQNISHKL